ncbi:MAG: hypothetical protein OXN15_06870, partial [Chloroflexota bacterium]|nr:hypothetical protein [Chloroflexota bacterium]
MVSELKVGLHIPAASDGPLPSAAQYVDFFRHAERLGFRGLWTEDRIFHNANLLEPLTLLTLAAPANHRNTNRPPRQHIYQANTPPMGPRRATK